MNSKRAQIDVEELLVFGYSCKLFRDDERAKIIDEGQHLIPWMGQSHLKIDRYDARGTLYDLTRAEPPPGGYDLFIELTENERAVELACDEERYRSLTINEDEDKLYKEEEEKRLEFGKAYGQVGYNYDDKKEMEEVEEEEAEVEDDRPFVPSPVLDIPINMPLPATMKHNAVIEKTALFISSQGAQMEIILKAKQAGNPMFDFLTFGNPLHGFYRLLLGYIKSGRYVPNSHPEPPLEECTSVEVSCVPQAIESAPSLNSPSQNDDSNSVSVYSELLLKLKMKAQALKQEQEMKLAAELAKKKEEMERKKLEAERLERLREEAERIKQEMKSKPPPQDVQLNIAKMASYAAKNGRKFETVIRNKKDDRYGFLEPSHEFHEFYLKKIRSYQGIGLDDKPESSEPSQQNVEKKDTAPKITPICFAIKPKEAPTIREKSALPVEENSDEDPEETDGLTDPTEFDLIEGGTKPSAIADKRLQLERKRKVSAFLKSLNMKEEVSEQDPSVVTKKVRTSRSASVDDASLQRS